MIAEKGHYTHTHTHNTPTVNLVSHALIWLILSLDVGQSRGTDGNVSLTVKSLTSQTWSRSGKSHPPTRCIPTIYCHRSLSSAQHSLPVKNKNKKNKMQINMNKKQNGVIILRVHLNIELRGSSLPSRPEAWAGTAPAVGWKPRFPYSFGALYFSWYVEGNTRETCVYLHSAHVAYSTFIWGVKQSQEKGVSLIRRGRKKKNPVNPQSSWHDPAVSDANEGAWLPPRKKKKKKETWNHIFQN